VENAYQSGRPDAVGLDPRIVTGFLMAGQWVRVERGSVIVYPAGLTLGGPNVPEGPHREAEGAAFSATPDDGGDGRVFGLLASVQLWRSDLPSPNRAHGTEPVFDRAVGIDDYPYGDGLEG